MLTEAEHEKAVKTFSDYMQGIASAVTFVHPSHEEIERATVAFIDAFYIALTEELAKSVPAEFLDLR